MSIILNKFSFISIEKLFKINWLKKEKKKIKEFKRLKKI